VTEGKSRGPQAPNRTLRAAVHPSASGTMRPLTRRIPPGPSSRSSRGGWRSGPRAGVP